MDPFPVVWAKLFELWKENESEGALQAIMLLSFTNKEIRENVDAIFKELFGKFSEIAFAIARAGLIIAKKERELKKEREMAEKKDKIAEEGEMSEEEDDIAEEEGETAEKEPSIMLGLSNSNDELYQEKVNLLTDKNYKELVLNFLHNDKQILYVFFAQNSEMGIRSLMEKTSKFSILEILVLITLAYANRVRDENFPYQGLLDKYSSLLSLFVSGGAANVFPLPEEGFTLERADYIGEDPEGECELFFSFR